MSATGDELRAARERLGISQAEVARRWGVSPRMVRKVETGAVPGKRYAESVRQLSRGIAAPPVRRVGASGEPVKVRTPGGGTATPTPPAPGVGRGAFGVQAGYTAGARTVVVTLPRTQGVGREQGRAAILDELRRGAQGHRGRGGKGQRAVVTVHTADGKDYTVGAKGGYKPSTALAGARGEGDDPLAWIADQLDGAGYDVRAGSIVRVTLTYLS